MFSPQPVSKKPPGVLSYSNPPSRDISQHSIPSFQSFIKRTPPPNDAQKPLPPSPPLAYGAEQRQNARERRRTSSVYSRLINQWAATPESWASNDLSSHTSLPSPSESSHPPAPHIGDPDDEILQPSVFRPLNMSSKAGYDSGVQFSPYPSHYDHEKHSPSETTFEDVKTMSLLEARDRASSKYAPALLPGELSAKARSNGSLRGSINSSTHRPSFDDSSSHKSPSSVRLHMRDTRNAKPKPSDLSPTYSDPYMKYAEAYRQDSDASLLSYERRGRPTERKPSPTSPIRYGPPSSQPSPAKSSPSEAERLAQMYHAVLRDESLQSSRSRRSRSPSASPTPDTRTQMKMIPQPLFFNPRQISDQRIKKHVAPRFTNAPPQRPNRPGILKTSASQPIQHTIPPMSCRRANTGLSDLSPRSDESDTPILGRFASDSRGREKSPRLMKTGGNGAGTFAAMKDMLATVNVSGKPFRRLSLHVPAAVKEHGISMGEVGKKLSHLKDRGGAMLETGKKKRERLREERKRELKGMIRVIPNA